VTTSTQRPLLVVGAGIAGITTALEAAEAGQEVVLLEREASVGGRVLKNHKYFPKLCPPSCGMEINVRRLERNPRVRLLTQARVESSERAGTGWMVQLRQRPEYVKASCTACGDCAKACPVTVPDTFNLGMGKVPAVRLPHVDAFPRRYVLDRAACPEGCRKCAEACKIGAIDLEAREREERLEVGAVVVATGWDPYPLEKLPELGGGVLPDVIANVQMERLAAPSGPTAGRIVRPSDGRAPKSVAFVQCAGSRDVHHLPYCSAVCCLASLKQALYVREQLPEASVSLYYIDRRTPGRNEAMLEKLVAAGVRLVNGKVGKVRAGAEGRLVLEVEHIAEGRPLEDEADLVVLATGMAPRLAADELPLPVSRDPDGFALDDRAAAVFAAGVARRPEDVAASVRDATGAAAKALCAARSA
jgi:quinone-modifying oxidoreductase subunit QmoA